MCGSIAWLIVVKAREVGNVEQAGVQGKQGERWRMKKERQRIGGGRGIVVVVHLQDSLLLLHLLCDPQIGIFIDVFCSCFD